MLHVCHQIIKDTDRSSSASLFSNFLYIVLQYHTTYVQYDLHVPTKGNLSCPVANICVKTLQKEPFEISVHCVPPYFHYMVSWLAQSCVSTLWHYEHLWLCNRMPSMNLENEARHSFETLTPFVCTFQMFNSVLFHQLSKLQSKCLEMFLRCDTHLPLIWIG